MAESSLKTRWIGPASASAPVVIVLHGFGADGDDLVPLAHWLAARTEIRYVVAEAPLSLPQGGRAWWNIDFAAREAQLARGEGLDLRKEKPPELEHARAAVTALFDAVRVRTGLPHEKVALLGFSQGAMLAFDTALHAEVAPACVGMLSGSFLNADEWTARFAARSHMPVFMSHGTHDPILPFRLSEELRDSLKSRGFDVPFMPFSGGHEIPLPVLEQLAAFLTRCFSTPTK